MVLERLSFLLLQELMRLKTQPSTPSEKSVKKYVKNLRQRDEEVCVSSASFCVAERYSWPVFSTANILHICLESGERKTCA